MSAPNKGKSFKDISTTAEPSRPQMSVRSLPFGPSELIARVNVHEEGRGDLAEFNFGRVDLCIPVRPIPEGLITYLSEFFEARSDEENAYVAQVLRLMEDLDMARRIAKALR